MEINFILDDNNNPQHCPDALEWSLWMHSHDRTVEVTRLSDKNLFVSTVFLGINHSFHLEGTPILFETMIFPLKEGGEIWSEDLYCCRYATYQEAKDGHAETLKAIHDGTLPKSE
jgi:hypothetical protein